MKTQSNVFFISVMILALITSPISFSEFAFASNHEDDSENFTIDLEESISITGEDVETEDIDEEEVDHTINQDTISNLGQEVSNLDRKGFWSVDVTGNWRITFRFVGGDVGDVNFEDYH